MVNFSSSKSTESPYRGEASSLHPPPFDPFMTYEFQTQI